jgi:hypothetical protein
MSAAPPLPCLNSWGVATSSVLLARSVDPGD